MKLTYLQLFCYWLGLTAALLWGARWVILAGVCVWLFTLAV